jgi:hypothetical protein
MMMFSFCYGAVTLNVFLSSRLIRGFLPRLLIGWIVRAGPAVSTIIKHLRWKIQHRQHW